MPGEEEGAEIDGALYEEAKEESSLGVAFQILVLEDMSDDEWIGALQRHYDHTSPGYVIGLRQHLDALRFGIFPQDSTSARQVAARMKSVMRRRRHGFSDSTRAVLE
ncbi:MAG: hypothetical protein F4138_03840 [Acidimicrobiia bacterium]|nr:hypothetical protein [Acidimicrobiia bacterium]MYC58240.1 hypothetical protein [Acidimicrobiia bacterium]MYG94109.1 hypothetical protein [Acidimicrobiia bacterium]MYI30118.1 hypothetical protein [Acidimicrobiia bacterium]